MYVKICFKGFFFKNKKTVFYKMKSGNVYFIINNVNYNE